MTTMWMVRAGPKARYIDEFRDKSIVAIGWGQLNDLSSIETREELAAAISRAWPEWPTGKIRNATGQIFRFARELQIGEHVISYAPESRTYLLGVISSAYRYDENTVGELFHVRSVKWNLEVDRDALSIATRNSLGSISTLFRVPDDAAAEIEAVANGKKTLPTAEESQDSEALDLLEDIEERASEFIKDKISKISWKDMQELVAGILRAMGYKTEVSSAGPDLGKDIVASPDGFGFESPRIIVEVKHRKGAMGSSAIRSFLGGRHKDDKGLYVSTGGFTKDARYEAERANIPITLLNMDDLVKKLVEHYEKIDHKTQRLVPLKMLYWPI